MGTSKQTAQQGSSPHARGAPSLIRRSISSLGIIPACAGSTSSHGMYQIQARDHPRMRGEHQEFCEKGNDMLGIIPACAGSTASLTFAKLLKEDHPRMRGEHPPPPRTLSLNAQSSPHARGAPLENVLVVVAIGIIPACAGSTTARRCPACATWDHPRMRGEHGLMSSSNFATKGSSPHARGAPSFYHVSVLEAVDHPRMRGEHAAMMMAVRVALWIIPACAGSTQSDQCAYHLGWDHPRMRGEH